MKKLLENHLELKLSHCLESLKELIDAKEALVTRDYGNEARFRKVLEELPNVSPSHIDTDADWIKIGEKEDLDEETRSRLDDSLHKLMPWRKGPFDVFGVRVDTEWASYIKWNRIKDKITPLTGKNVLDIGCSSGYYLFRMAASKPQMALGIDPQVAFYYQYRALQHFMNLPDIYYIPAKMEELPGFDSYFDSVFCMGILYHRKSPIDTLSQIHEKMKKGGEIILETLIIEGDSDTALFPVDRYAKMRNVFFLPTVKCLTSWMMRAGFEDIQCIDVSETTLEEQRKTDWIVSESLEHFIDPEDPAKTVEGYPAPVRAVMIGRAK